MQYFSPQRRRTVARHDSDRNIDGSIVQLDDLARVDSTVSQLQPPTFEQSEHDIILRRQRSRNSASNVKHFTAPSRFSSENEAWEFAGWGRVESMSVSPSDLQRAREAIEEERTRVKPLNHWVASAVDANAVFGSVFYSLPAVVAVAGVLSPISLVVAMLLLFTIRPVMIELGSAFPLGGSAYTYLLNSSSKSAALVAAALVVLDYIVNSVNAAGCAAAYVAGETALPFSQAWLAVIILLAFALVGLLGVKESSSLAFAISTLHVGTMIALMLASAIAWGRNGNTVLRANWNADIAGRSPAGIVRAIFNGVCLGFLGSTGLECAPEYASVCRPGAYPKLLRNLQWGALLLNGPLMLLVFAVLPSGTILGGFNILSVLAEVAVSRGFRIFVAIDAVICLCAGVLTGSVSACSLLDRLASDRVLPSALLRRLPVTYSPWVTQLVFTTLCCAVWASTGASLAIVAKIFTISFLCVLALFPISACALKFNRGRLARAARAPLPLVIVTLALLAVVLAGNVALDPTTLGYFAAYALALAAVLLSLKHWVAVLRLTYWLYDQSDWLRRSPRTRTWGDGLIKAMRRLRRRPVACFVKTDEINSLIRLVLYVQANEPTSRLIFVHLFEAIEKVPRDFEAFAKILDEAFPSITIDMARRIFVQGTFDPSCVHAICNKLGVPKSCAMMSTPGPNFPYTLADFGGVRIATL